jgi:hypothetical protein
MAAQLRAPTDCSSDYTTAVRLESKSGEHPYSVRLWVALTVAHLALTRAAQMAQLSVLSQVEQ